MSRKTSTLLIATKTPRTCNECRHANHGTVDFGEGRLFCWFVNAPKRSGQRCDATLELSRTRGGPTSAYHLFEAFTDDNGTFDRAQDLRILAEDADDVMRADLGG